MKSLGRWISHAAGAALLAVAATAAGAAIAPQAAEAQVAYGSYVGIGAGLGLTSDAATGRGGGVQGVISGRYRLLQYPVSLRAQGFIFGGDFAFVPTVSYDIPLSWNTDVYVGAGASFVGGGGDDPSLVGDKTAFVVQPGIDHLFPNSNLVAFGNAIFAFDAYRQGGNMAISVQGGVGIQF
ncbi:hypothetical protein VB780_02090 [Leptolyngbya sp. CCNP1308]|uniref:hypothetical protein n=1 Tax=Leptolyngbya sp. CCNP1308 TaxID=3110255 RepID=UPI002B1FBD18|nr:hypothetical protein [Leptolyngbya sp. CCNP1308]MEA5447341.1 hypothetical protein [Leptolyngbya sp. CCNP1308]